MYSNKNIRNDLQQSNININTNWDYRKYLQTNSTKIMDYNHFEAINGLGFNPVINNNFNSSKNVPFVFNSNSKGESIINYNNSDLKSLFMKRQFEDSVQLTPNFK